MKYFLIGLAGFFLVLLMIFSWFVGTYNGLVAKRLEVQTQQGQIETQLQRRFDLVPNLVGAVKGAMKQEQAIFKAIADARTHYAGAASGTPDKLQAANQYEGALARLLVVIENYPQLKSVDIVRDLLVQLEGTENRISVARQRYNEAVQSYNFIVQRFPSSIVASFGGFKEAVFFKGETDSEKAPKVNF